MFRTSLFVFSGLVLLAFSVLLSGQEQDAKALTEKKSTSPHSLSELAWLAETWRTDKDGKRSEEVWMEPAGGLMMGMNRSVRGRQAAFENLRIVESAGEITYWASPQGAKATPFVLTDLSGSKVVFENSEHDFPQRITYQRLGDDLIARIEGTVGGQVRAMEFQWRKLGTGPRDSLAKFRGLRSAIYRVEDLQKAKAWYTKAIGVQPYFDEPYYVGFKIGNQELGLDPDIKSLTRGNNQSAYWEVESCQQAFDELLKVGAKSDAEPQDVGGGTTVATVLDPFGNTIGLIETATLPVK